MLNENIIELKEYLSHVSDDILDLNDEFIYKKFGNREDIKLLLSSDKILFENFNEKLESIFPLFDTNMKIVNNEGGLTKEIDTLLPKLIIRDYLGRFDKMKYKMKFIVKDIIDLHFTDVFYFLFLSFGDCLVDDYKYTPEIMKSIYTSLLSCNTDFVKEKIKSLDNWENVLKDIETYIEFMKEHSFNLSEYHYITKEILDVEFRKQSKDSKTILFNRLYVNTVMMLGFKNSEIKTGETNEKNIDKMKLLYNGMLIGILHDDIEDLEEDIANGAPTYVRYLYENNTREEYVKKINQVTVYKYLTFFESIKESFNGKYTPYIMAIDIIKVLLLKSFC